VVRIRKFKVLIKPEDIKPSSSKFGVLGVLNPGAARLKNGKIVLYVRVIEKLKKHEDSKYYYSPRCVGKDKFHMRLDKFKKSLVDGSSNVDFSFKDKTKRLTYISHLRRVILDESGFKVLKIDKRPSFYGLKWDAELGVEDTRITKIGENYFMTYVGLTRNENISTNLAASNDGLTWFRRGIIFGEQDKDTVLFPEKINEEYVAYDRPEGNFGFSPPHIWVAYSKDMEYWGKLKGINLSEKHTEFSRSGAGPPPIKTDKGWLLIFHAITSPKNKGFIFKLKKFFGLKVEPGSEVYAVWAALFDLKNPEKLIARSHHPIMIPRGTKSTSYEGKEVVFPTGMVEDNNGKDILLFSGSGDIYTTVHKIRKKDIFKTLIFK